MLTSGLSSPKDFLATDILILKEPCEDILLNPTKKADEIKDDHQHKKHNKKQQQPYGEPDELPDKKNTNNKDKKNRPNRN
jgi:hypothetical protein